jgi:hypothetical protein
MVTMGEDIRVSGQCLPLENELVLSDHQREVAISLLSEAPEIVRACFFSNTLRFEPSLFGEPKYAPVAHHLSGRRDE